MSNFKRIVLALSALSMGATVAFGAPIITQGGVSVSGQGQYSGVANTTTVNFNDGTAPVSGQIIYTLPAGNLNGTNGNIVQGGLAGVYASPVNDTSAYLTVGPTGNRSPVVITFGQLVDYFGFYASSLDTYNSVEFRANGSTIFTLSGTQIAALGGFPADGNQMNGLYVNIVAGSGEAFDQIVLTSTSNAFETDNHAFRALSGAPLADVPEPSSIAMFGAAAAVVALRMRRISSVTQVRPVTSNPE